MIDSTRLRIWFSLMVSMCISITTYAQRDTSSIYFQLDRSEIDNVGLQKLDSLIYTDAINQSQELLIIGYADHLGTNDYNDTLSSKRANNVRSYLMSMHIPAEHITMCIGKGEVPRDVELPDGYAADRRVDVVEITKQQADELRSLKKKIKPVKIDSKDAIKFNSDIEFNPELLDVGQLFVLDKIFFYTGRHRVVDESLPELDRLYSILEEIPTLVINIEGHVCCVHPSVDALDLETGEIALSVNRAKYIYNYLIRRGIDKGRLSYEGFGKKFPISPYEMTREDQDINKRVEIRILKK